MSLVEWLSIMGMPKSTPPSINRCKSGSPRFGLDDSSIDAWFKVVFPFRKRSNMPTLEEVVSQALDYSRYVGGPQFYLEKWVERLLAYDTNFSRQVSIFRSPHVSDNVKMFIIKTCNYEWYCQDAYMERDAFLKEVITDSGVSPTLRAEALKNLPLYKITIRMAEDLLCPMIIRIAAIGNMHRHCSELQGMARDLSQPEEIRAAALTRILKFTFPKWPVDIDRSGFLDMILDKSQPESVRLAILSGFGSHLIAEPRNRKWSAILPQWSAILEELFEGRSNPDILRVRALHLAMDTYHNNNSGARSIHRSLPLRESDYVRVSSDPSESETVRVAALESLSPSYQGYSLIAMDKSYPYILRRSAILRLRDISVLTSILRDPQESMEIKSVALLRPRLFKVVFFDPTFSDDLKSIAWKLWREKYNWWNSFSDRYRDSSLCTLLPSFNDSLESSQEMIKAYLSPNLLFD